MPRFEALLAAHATRYPGLQPQDAIKLLYQRTMGNGHLIANAQEFALRFAKEAASPEVAAQGTAPWDSLGNGYCRVHLSTLAGVDGQSMASLCSISAQKGRQNRDELVQGLDFLKNWEFAGAPGLAKSRMAAAVEEYIKEGMPPIGHSGRYRRLYKPHYRVMRETEAMFLPVFAAIDKALKQKSHVLVGVDGMSGAGKSKLAELLTKVYGCGVVHADDFFLQPHQRTEERLATVGGNIDYERLHAVARLAADDRPFMYEPYNCQTARLEKPVQVPGARVTLLEGVYCMHPQINAPFDVRVFLSVGATVQQRRIEKRSGQELAGRYQREWIPMENAYFREFCVREGCDVALDTSAIL